MVLSTAAAICALAISAAPALSVKAPTPVKAPLVSGVVQVGSILTASPGTWRPKPASVSYRWEAERTVTVTTKTTVKGKVRVIRKAVLRWQAIPGASASTLTPVASLQGLRLRACAQAAKGGQRSDWRCSAASGPVAAPTPTPSPPASVAISYAETVFAVGMDAQRFLPTITGAQGTQTFSVQGTLPEGVTFSEATGAFFGPAFSDWTVRATQVSAGGAHTCALTTGGAVKCWGDDNWGQIGDAGSNARQSSPADVVGLGNGTATQVSAGSSHTCAVTTQGAVKCWGDDDFGQIGNGATTGNQTSPVPVEGLSSGVAQVSAGNYHTCALTTLGAVKCWGYDGSGQIGNGATITTTQTSPVPVDGLSSGVAQVSAGGNHTCALTTQGAVKCWGANYDGQIGDGGANVDQTSPLPVPGLGNGTATQVSAGSGHTCAVTTQGAVKCWGNDDYGQIGNGGSNAARPSPEPVQALGNGTVTQVSAGSLHTCALTTQGAVKCWGDDRYSQIGDGGVAGQPRTTPVAVVGLTDGVAQVSAGGLHTCALTTQGAVKCWGSDSSGQIGDVGSYTDQHSPVQVRGLQPQAGFPAALRVVVTDSRGVAGSVDIILGTF